MIKYQVRYFCWAWTFPRHPLWRERRRSKLWARSISRFQRGLAYNWQFRIGTKGWVGIDLWICCDWFGSTKNHFNLRAIITQWCRTRRLTWTTTAHFASSRTLVRLRWMRYVEHGIPLISSRTTSNPSFGFHPQGLIHFLELRGSLQRGNGDGWRWGTCPRQLWGQRPHKVNIWWREALNVFVWSYICTGWLKFA